MKLICGDNAEEMAKMEAGSIHLVVTSPPYDNLRSYNGFSWDFEAVAKQIYRVLCDGGVCCWNVGDSVVDGSETLTSFKQAIYFKEQCGFRVHDTMIWEKPNFANPASNRYHQVFEYVFILSKGAQRCFNPIKDKPNKYPGGPLGKNTCRQADGTLELKTHERRALGEFGMRGNVWKGNSRGQEDMCQTGGIHPAMMPKWLARDLIISWSSEGDTVLDPFVGSGTVVQEAEKIGRFGIGIDISPEYIAAVKPPELPEPTLF